MIFQNKGSGYSSDSLTITKKKKYPRNLNNQRKTVQVPNINQTGTPEPPDLPDPPDPPPCHQMEASLPHNMWLFPY